MFCQDDKHGDGNSAIMELAKWRIPHKEIQTAEGRFRAVSALPDHGFVASPFSGWPLYGLISEELKNKHPLYLASYGEHIPGKQEYIERCELFIDACANTHLQKVILSRPILVKKEIDPHIFFERLCEKYPYAYVSMLSSPHFGTWCGASPELLCKFHGNHLDTVSLAGTRSIQSDEPWKEKEREEQAIVTRAILNGLSESGAMDIRTSLAGEYAAGPVKHLSTSISATFTGDLSLLLKHLHPTPAISGFPKTPSIDFIAQQEGYNRELYGGILGEMGAQSTLWVNLRCAQIVKEGVVIYVGGGITAHSDPEHEWQETELKAETMISVLENM